MSTTISKILVTNALSEASLAVLESLTTEKKFTVHALVNEGITGTPELSRLRNLGVEIVIGSLLDKKALTSALTGIDGVFLNLDFSKCAAEQENTIEKQGKLFIEVCQELGTVKHIVFSSYENYEKLCEAKCPIPEFAAACLVGDLIRSSKISYTEVKFGFLMSTLKSLAVYKSDEKVFEFDIPMADKRLDMIAPEDLGTVVLNVFQNVDKYRNQIISIAGDSLTVEEMVEIFSKVTHKHARYPEISVKHFKEMAIVPEPIALGNMFHILQELSGKVFDVKKSREEFPQLHSFENWLLAGAWEFPEERR